MARWGLSCGGDRREQGGLFFFGGPFGRLVGGESLGGTGDGTGDGTVRGWEGSTMDNTKGQALCDWPARARSPRTRHTGKQSLDGRSALSSLQLAACGLQLASTKRTLRLTAFRGVSLCRWLPVLVLTNNRQADCGRRAAGCPALRKPGRSPHAVVCHVDLGWPSLQQQTGGIHIHHCSMEVEEDPPPWDPLPPTLVSCLLSSET